MNELNKVRSALAANPVMVLFLGATPALGATATMLGALSMGIAVLLIMLLSALVLSALKNILNEKFLIPAAVLVSAGFASLLQMLMNAFLPEVYSMIGIYVAVAAVNLLIFAGTENAVYGSKALGDAAISGLIFTVVLTVMGAVREILGSASIAGIEIAFLSNYTISVFGKAPGAFMVFAAALAVVNKYKPAAKAEGIAFEAAGMEAKGE